VLNSYLANCQGAVRSCDSFPSASLYGNKGGVCWLTNRAMVAHEKPTFVSLFPVRISSVLTLRLTDVSTASVRLLPWFV